MMFGRDRRHPQRDSTALNRRINSHSNSSTGLRLLRQCDSNTLPLRFDRQGSASLTSPDRKKSGADRCRATRATHDLRRSDMGLLQEFREFAVKGNMIDMAVGIIVGGAFGTIVSSLVKDIIMPPIGMLLGGVDFSDIRLTLAPASNGKDAVTMNIGSFLNNVISFLIVAWAVFMLVKAINELKKRFEKEKVAEAAAEPTLQEKLLMEIRDSLKR